MDSPIYQGTVEPEVSASLISGISVTHLNLTGVVEIKSKLKTETTPLSTTCTGTFVAPDLVLTARHCVADHFPYRAPEKICSDTVYSSTNNCAVFEKYDWLIELGTPGVRPYYSSKVLSVQFPDVRLDSQGVANWGFPEDRLDVALMKVETNFPMYNLPLYYGGFPQDIPDHTVKSYGFGYSQASWSKDPALIGEASKGTLRTAVYPVLPSATSTFTGHPAFNYGGIPHPFTELLYAGGNQAGQGNMRGDSGGPLYATVNGKMRLAGVDSICDWQEAIAKSPSSSPNMKKEIMGFTSTAFPAMTDWLEKASYNSPNVLSTTTLSSMTLENQNVVFGNFAEDLALDELVELTTGNPETISVRKSNGDGTFGTPIVSPFSSGTSWDGHFVYVDVSGDNKLDYIYLGDSAIYTRLGTGLGTFGGTITSSFSATAPGGPVGWYDEEYSNLAYLGEDGCADYVYIASNKLYTRVARCDGTGTFLDAHVQDVSAMGVDLHSELVHSWFIDVDNDFVDDFVTVVQTTEKGGPTKIVVMLGSGDTAGTFHAPITTNIVDPKMGGWDDSWYAAVYFSDVDGDGCNDFIYVSPHDIWVKESLCSGDFELQNRQAPLEFAFERTWDNTMFTDMNGDGKADFLSVGDTSVWARQAFPAAANRGYHDEQTDGLLFSRLFADRDVASSARGLFTTATMPPDPQGSMYAHAASVLSSGWIPNATTPPRPSLVNVGPSKTSVTKFSAFTSNIFVPFSSEHVEGPIRSRPRVLTPPKRRTPRHN